MGQWIRSALFVGQIYVMMALMALAFLPFAMLRRRWAFAAIHAWCGWVRWTARWMVGLRTEIRGPLPPDGAIIAAKHQSFLDIILITSAVPEPRFIMKASLMRAPFLGWFAWRIGCVPVDRGKRAEAVEQLRRGVAATAGHAGQIVIYPQGTRVAPGDRRPYKIGTAVMYRQLDWPCVPAATNVGLFWPRRGIWRKPGLAVVEFLPHIPPGLPPEAFMAEIETRIETASDRLMDEARGAGA